MLPEGSFYEMDYYTSSSAPEFVAGGLKGLRLPTGGEYRWTYDRLRYQSQDPGDDRFDRDVKTVRPVIRKEVALTKGGPSIGAWEYFYEASTDSVPGDALIPCHRSTTVRDPVGNEVRSFFSTSNALHLWSYGLPFTRCAPGVGYDAAGTFLSTEVYEGTVETGTKLRSVFVEYGSDGHGLVGNGQVNQAGCLRSQYRARMGVVELRSSGLDHVLQVFFPMLSGSPDPGKAVLLGLCSKSTAPELQKYMIPGGFQNSDPVVAEAGAARACLTIFLRRASGNREICR